LRSARAGARLWAAALRQPACCAAGLYAWSIMCSCWRRITRRQASADGLRALGLHVEPRKPTSVRPHSGQKRRGLKSHLDERGILATVGTRTRLVTHLMYRS